MRPFTEQVCKGSWQSGRNLRRGRLTWTFYKERCWNGRMTSSDLAVAEESGADCSSVLQKFKRKHLTYQQMSIPNIFQRTRYPFSPVWIRKLKTIDKFTWSFDGSLASVHLWHTLAHAYFILCLLCLPYKSCWDLERPAASKKAIKCESLNKVRSSSTGGIKTMDNSSYALRFLVIDLIHPVNTVHFCGYLPLKRERLVSGVILLFPTQWWSLQLAPYSAVCLGIEVNLRKTGW